jgi:hypothetical protein
MVFLATGHGGCAVDTEPEVDELGEAKGSGVVDSLVSDFEVDGLEVDEARKNTSHGELGTLFTLGLVESAESGTYIEGFDFKYDSINCTNCDTRLVIEHWTRQTATSSYKQSGTITLVPGQKWAPCRDGRRTRIYIFGYYPREFYNFQWSWVDCA